jgi:hypothetical protein
MYIFSRLYDLNILFGIILIILIMVATISKFNNITIYHKLIAIFLEGLIILFLIKMLINGNKIIKNIQGKLLFTSLFL